MVRDRLTLPTLRHSTLVLNRLGLRLRFVAGLLFQGLKQVPLLGIRQPLALAAEHLTCQPRHLALQLDDVL